MKTQQNSVGWFEIPVKNMERAINFYQKLLSIELQPMQMGHVSMAWFPHDESAPGAAGSLIYAPDHYQPSANGTLVYLSSTTGDLSDELRRVEPEGGKVVQEKTLITEDIGYMAVFIDSEGNRLALHSRK